MKLGMVVYSTDAETLWNAFRLGMFTLTQGDSVKAFLFGKGVECEKHDAEPFNVRKQMQDYQNAGGVIMACGTCLQIRNSQSSELCPLFTMKDLWELIRDCDKVVTF